VRYWRLPGALHHVLRANDAHRALLAAASGGACVRAVSVAAIEKPALYIAGIKQRHQRRWRSAAARKSRA